ncbi:magnesium-translocating P-type ATPase [Streptomyces diastaticus]
MEPVAERAAAFRAAAPVPPRPPAHEPLAPPDAAGLTALQLLRAHGSGPRGLTEDEAARRLARYGENALPARRRVTRRRRLLRSLRDPFTTVLLCLGVLSAVVAAWGTATVILSLVLVSCVLRVSGEHRADRSVALLRALLPTTATVVRRAEDAAESRTREVPVGEVVPGDVVRLGPGDLVPADVRLLRATGLSVHQQALTGESAPVPKHAVQEPGESPPGPFAPPHLCFQGSSVAYGSATALVTATGAATRFAAAHRAGDRRRFTAFDRSVHGISWTLIRFMLLTPPLVLVAGAALHGRGLETLPFAVAVAVGLTPEMLPVVVTTALARGAARLAREHRVIVTRLPALHDLGSVDVLCLDKTGTLTQDRPVVTGALDAEGRDDPEVLRWAAANAWWTLHLADLPVPDALDEAVLEAAQEMADGPEGVAALPFDPVRRLSTAVLRTPGRLGRDTLVVKGAVEQVLDRCVLDAEERARLLDLAAAEAAAGSRLLAVAVAERPARHGEWSHADERGLTFRGLVTFGDALAPTAADALAELAGRGVGVKILTGDHPGTAAQVCRALGLDPGRVLTADEADRLTDAELGPAARRTAVFARCGPEHKARIVTALRATGHTVGFLGDGVNDLPALHAADVGLCPRESVDAVRECADVVLAEKDLAAVDRAITAGRHSGGNIGTYLRITLSSNLGNVFAMLATALLLPFLPMLPAQVLVQNLCFDAAQLAFAYERPSRAVLRRPTRLRQRGFLRFITGFGLINAAADVATFGVLALTTHGAHASQEAFHAGWFTENLLTQALVMVVLRGGRHAAEGRTAGPVHRAALGLAVIGVLLPLSPLGPPLAMGTLPPLYYVLLATVLALYAAVLVVARDRYGRAADAG